MEMVRKCTTACGGKALRQVRKKLDGPVTFNNMTREVGISKDSITVVKGR